MEYFKYIIAIQVSESVFKWFVCYSVCVPGKIFNIACNTCTCNSEGTKVSCTDKICLPKSNVFFGLSYYFVKFLKSTFKWVVWFSPILVLDVPLRRPHFNNNYFIISKILIHNMLDFHMKYVIDYMMMKSKIKVIQIPNYFCIKLKLKDSNVRKLKSMIYFSIYFGIFRTVSKVIHK